MTTVLTLPCDSSLDYFEDNTLAHYRVQLPHELHFDDGDYEVGLSQLQYPNTWYNVSGESLMIRGAYVTDNQEYLYSKAPVSIREGFYDSASQLISTINAVIARLEFAVPDRLMPFFEYDKISNKVVYRVMNDKQVILKLHSDLLIKLGFTPHNSTQTPRWLKPGSVGERVVDLRGGFHNVFVYTDIVKSARIVGDSLQPLLRAVPVTGKHGDMRFFQPNIIDWLPLRFKHFRQVEVYLMTDLGGLIPFENGKVQVTVHIRRARLWSS